ncbi:MAG TPA: peptide ABC transporter substrate-binding protein [Candidatus Tumulicola sp.]
MRRLAPIAAFAVLAACSHLGDRTAATTTALTIAQQREPMSLNPALENGASSTEWGLMLFQYLVKFDDSGRLVGDAATAVPSVENGGISRDGLTIVYHLRKHLRFADGKPLTAADCVWSIHAVQNPSNDVQTRYGYDRVASATAPDPTTLVLRLKEPFAPLLTLVLAPQGFPILPEHVLARYPNFNHLAFGELPIGSGPYVVTRWDRGDRVAMRANPYYWQGKPRIERLTVRFVPDANTALNLLRTREVGGFFNDEDLGNYPTLRAIAGTYVSNEPIDAVGSIIFNTQDPIVRDPRVRHALAEAIDFRSVVEKTYHGALDSADAGRGLFIWAYDRRAYPDVPFDPQAAGKLLDAAGWRLDAAGARSKNGKPLDLLFIIQAQTPGDQIVGNLVAAYARAIGVRVTLKQYSVTQFVAPANLGGPVYGGHFQLALYSFVNGDDPDTTDQFSCSHVPPNGYNKSRICDPAIDALLTQGRRTNVTAARKAIYARLQRLLYAQLPVALLYQEHQISAFTTRLRGQTTSLSGAFWNVGRWTLSS